MPKSSNARVVFRYPNFVYHASARVLWVLAAEMQAVAVGWQVYELTHRPLDLGLVGLAQFLPGILLFLVTGHTADRFPRLRILQICCAGFALASALLLALTLGGLTRVAPIYAVLLLNGTVRAFNGPAGQAFVPLLVPPEIFPKAVAWNSSIFQAATIAGPMIGGLLYALTASPRFVYGCAGCEYLAALLILGFIRIRAAQGARPAASLSMALEGVRYIRRNRMILGAISLDLFAVLLGGAVALLPVYARDILHTGPWGLGLLRTAPGAGAAVMAVLLAHRPLRGKSGPTLLWAVAGFGVFTILFGVSRSLTLSLIALFLLGASDMISVIIRATLTQLATPDEMRGRVTAVDMIFIGTSNEFGQFESGVTAQWFGTVPAVVLGGIGTLVVIALWAWWFPELRNAGELHEITAEVETATTANPA